LANQDQRRVVRLTITARNSRAITALIAAIAEHAWTTISPSTVARF